MADPPVDTLLEERPDLEPALESVAAVDERQGTWTFADVDIDSGAFGELVSRGVVEEHDGAYRLANPDAVRAALAGESPADTGDRSLPSVLPDVEVDRRDAGALAGVLALVVFARLVALPAVFRDGAVVLSGNDPYYYRYWVERLLVQSGGVFDFSVLSGLSGAVAKGEPLTVATLWWVSAILGDASGWVLAWYPVLAALAAAVFVYRFAVDLTEDRRVGLAAVALLAVTPGHALRTGLGFADHHAFDYPWLVLAAWGVVALARRRDAADLRHPATWWAALALGVGVAGQVLAWEAGPLLVVPGGLAVAALVLYDVRADRSPVRTNAPFVAGLALASVPAAFFHTVFGWHTDQVAYAPALLLVGTLGVLAVAEAVHRLDVPSPVRVLAGLEALGLVVAVLAFQTVLPTYWARLTSQLDRLFGAAPIAEVQPLFAANTFGFMLLFGWVLVLAIPYMGWGVLRAYRGDDGPRWAVAGIYAWYCLLLAALQMRFAGQLAHFAAVFAGLGFVHLAERVDVARPPAPFSSTSIRDLPLPDARQAGALVVLFLLVSSLGIVMVPVKTSQVTIGAEEYRAADWMATDAAERGLEYPENYVFSPWSRNRMYNYFVSGQSQSYGYAQSNYDSFMAATQAGPWYDRLEGRAGYVLTKPVDSDPATVHARLHDHYGSRTEEAPGLAHYRAVYASDDGSMKVFSVVPGARIRGTAGADATVTVTTQASLSGTTFDYERQAIAGPNGTYSVTVPYPGEYTVGERTVRVSETAVQNGTVVQVS